MEVRDLLITPIIIVVVFVIAFQLRSRFTDNNTRGYFLPALALKIIGAIAIGFIFQFYYDGGDTFLYHFSSRKLWEAVWESPVEGITIFFRSALDYTGVYKYASKIFFFKDPQSLVIVKIAAFFDLFTFSTYSATAVLFAVFSFVGMWSLYQVFYRQYAHLHKQLAWCILFIPSVFFWGSGVLKDSIVLGCLALATYHFYLLFFEKKIKLFNILILIGSLYLIFSVKKFILQAYFPSVILWIVSRNLTNISSVVAKMMIIPFLIGAVAYSSYFSVIKVGEGDKRFSVEKIAETAKVTAYDIRYWSGREAGSGYSLGELDGSFGSMVRLAPQAINVSLFRPYLWEVRNPLMLLSALEGAFFLLFALMILMKKRTRIFQAFTDPNVIFAFTFAISFAFAIGVSTFNFGTLARYKIPLLPFFAVALVLVNYRTEKENSRG